MIDLQPLFFRLILDITTVFLFRESVRSLKFPESTKEQTFAKAFNIAQEYIVKRYRLLELYWLIGGRKFQNACDKVHKFADQIIDWNLTLLSQDDRQSEYVFLCSLAQKTLDQKALRGQIINILTVGQDTTACLLS